MPCAIKIKVIFFLCFDLKNLRMMMFSLTKKGEMCVVSQWEKSLCFLQDMTIIIDNIIMWR